MIDNSVFDGYGIKINKIDLNRSKIEVENEIKKEEELMEWSSYLRKKLPILQNNPNYTQDGLVYALNILNDKIKTTTDKIGNSEALSIIEKEISRYNLQNKKQNNGLTSNNGSIDSKVKEFSYIGKKFVEINGNNNGGGIKYSKDVSDDKQKGNKDESIKIKNIYKEKNTTELLKEADNLLNEYKISKKKGIQKIISEEEIEEAQNEAKEDKIKDKINFIKSVNKELGI